MDNIVNILESKKSLIAGEGVSVSYIKEAERMLKLEFAEEYKDYLLKFGIAAFDGHELTGITKSPRLNVVSVTLSEKLINPRINNDLYVIEETNVEEIVIWQNSKGEIYSSGPNIPLKKVCNSFSEYIVGGFKQDQ